MPTVPNWIAKAVIYTPGYGTTNGSVTPILSWRATNTQVVVEVMRRGVRVERRFRLDKLTEVGQSSSHHLPRLMPPDASEVLAVQERVVVNQARSMVLNEVATQRLVDSSASADAVLTKLLAVQDAVNKAIASLGPVL